MVGPVYMTINSDTVPYQYYFRGIIDSKKCLDGKVTHAVLGVGYGVDRSQAGEPVEYVIIKNSYGKYWGENGYARISLATKNHAYGVCSILRYNLVAVVNV